MSNNYTSADLVGLVWSQPFLLFALRNFKRKSAAAEAKPDELKQWLTLSLGAAIPLALAPTLTIFMSTMRYLLDIVPCCTILAALGYWQVLDDLENKPRLARGVRRLVMVVVFVQCAIGLLLSVESAQHNFSGHNPELFLWIRSALPTFN